MVNDDDYKKYDSYTIFNYYKTHLVLLLFFVLFIFIVTFSLLGNQPIMESAKPWLFMIEIILWMILITVIVLNVKTIKSGDIDFTQQLMNLIGVNDPEMRIDIKREGGNDGDKCVNNSQDYGFNRDDTDKEVFHIPNNIYKYEEAYDVCKLFDSRLATYEEVERSYNNGGSWCSYGWSADQLALFPTQKEVYNELKMIPGRERDCGRPGVNGGYIKNKNIEFGINCYGKKPYITANDKEYINQRSYAAAFSKMSSDIEKNKNDKINNVLVAPFNKNYWNEV